MLTTRVHGHRTVITASGYRVDAPLAHYFGAGDVYTGLMFAATGWAPGRHPGTLRPDHPRTVRARRGWRPGPGRRDPARGHRPPQLTNQPDSPVLIRPGCPACPEAAPSPGEGSSPQVRRTSRFRRA